MSPPAARLVLFFTLAVALSDGDVWAADTRDQEAARLFFNGQYQQAMDLYIALALEKKNPQYMCNIGRCQMRLGRTSEAIDNLRDCLARAKLDAHKREEYQSLLDELVEKANGPEPSPVDESAPSSAPAPVVQVVAPAAPPPPPEPAPALPAPERRSTISAPVWLAGVCGLAAVATGATSGLLARDLSKDLGLAYDSGGEGKLARYNAAQVIAYSAGAIALGAAVVVHLRQASGPERNLSLGKGTIEWRF